MLQLSGAPVDGTSPRNFLYGPGYKVVDLALSRDFRFSERYRLGFRAEGTNILNNVNYEQPAPAVPATPTALQPSEVSAAQRLSASSIGARFSFSERR